MIDSNPQHTSFGNKGTPFFTVVMPVYNKERYVARSIQSVLDQTCRDFDLIIVCDPSTDGSNAVVAGFTDDRIRVLFRDQPGPGGYAARNRGIREAKTEWIAFLDADDTWHPEHLERMAAAINDNPEKDVFSAGWSNHAGRDHVYMDSYFQRHSSQGPHAFGLREFMWGAMPAYTSVVVARKSLLTSVGGFDETLFQGGDLELWFRLLLHSETGGYWVNQCNATYFRNVDNQVTAHFKLECSPITTRIGKILADDLGNGTLDTMELKRFANKRTVQVHIRKDRAHDFDTEKLANQLYANALSWPEKAVLFLLRTAPLPNTGKIVDYMIRLLARLTSNRRT